MIVHIVLLLAGILAGWYHPEIIAAFKSWRNGS
jgi:hypothetical protein